MDFARSAKSGGNLEFYRIMSLKIGIVGLPNVGKSTLFKALTRQQVHIANYPFATIDPNIGVVEVPDDRMRQLALVSRSEKMIPSTVEFVDIAGLVKGAHQGEGLGNQFLSHIREVDAIVQVVRIFEDKNIIHVHGKIDPKEDAEIINIELGLADLNTVNKRLIALRSQIKAGKTRELDQTLSALEKIKAAIEKGLPARAAVLDEEEQRSVKDLNLLTKKPVMYVLNVGETDDLNKKNDLAGAIVKSPEEVLIPVSLKIESELADLPPEETKEFLFSSGIKETGLEKIIKAGYQLLDLITFFTSGPKETRAWPIKRGLKAPQAAGKIHGDFERGFIAAEIINWKDLVETGGEVKARESGKLRLEGKEYVMRDGDVAHFRFNV